MLSCKYSFFCSTNGTHGLMQAQCAVQSRRGRGSGRLRPVSPWVQIPPLGPGGVLALMQVLLFSFNKQNPRPHAGAMRRSIPLGAGETAACGRFPRGFKSRHSAHNWTPILIQWVFTIGVQFFCSFRITKTEKSLTNRDLYTSQINTRRLLCCSVCCFPSV